MTDNEQSNGILVLAVEDDTGILELMNVHLSKLCKEIAFTTSGHDTINFLKNTTPDLMLLDYGLPDMNGIELIHSINQENLSLPPFIVSTGRGDECIAVEMMKLGARDYIVKDSNFWDILPEVLKRVAKGIDDEKKRMQAEEDIKAKNEELKESLERIQKINLELEEAKKHAEESDRLKTAFLANMSHEIRTPMNGIIGFSELLKTENLPREKQVEYLEVIVLCGNRMLKMIGDLIDISKIEAGLTEVHPENTSANLIIDELYTFYKPEVESKGIKLYSTKGLPLEESIVCVDKDKIYQVLSNLLNNAIKFTNSGEIKFGYHLHANAFVFYVQDTGIGISDDMKERIFERFRQVDISISRKYEGSGLGLSISKAFVELHDGKIWLESEPEVGSTFYFSIPIKTHEKGSVETTENEDGAYLPLPSGKTILVADDDKVSFLLLKEAMYKENIKVIHAKNGVAAVELVRKVADIELVLMDIKMPEMDGLEATRIIKKSHPKLPIIAQTAFAQASDKKEVLSAGCDDYLAKPINTEELFRLIRKYVDGK